MTEDSKTPHPLQTFAVQTSYSLKAVYVSSQVVGKISKPF